MPNPAKNGLRYRFGPFELDCAEGRLSRNGTSVKVQDLPFRLLVMLVERPGEIVTREEVRQHLWPENTFVEFDNSLGVAIRKVRDSLGDDAESPRYVETVPRRGYRFLAPVTMQGRRSPLVSPRGRRNGLLAGCSRVRSSGWCATPRQSVLGGGRTCASRGNGCLRIPFGSPACILERGSQWRCAAHANSRGRSP